ncbi:MAG TPA: nucleotidyltransferase family protein [Solirubrobacteraceae bacterium]|jgi:hypothetical protein|nr:nucleotidyltransferase family protein [Solirubrobacteraceae bacterium]
MSDAQAERRLILLSAGTAARRETARAQAGELASRVDWPRLAATLRARRLLSLLGPRILELAGPAADDEFAAAVAQALELGRKQGMLLQVLTQRMVAMLAEAGICSAPLKGPLLGEAIHGESAHRLSSDIDVLVAPEQLFPAVEVMRGLGYGAPTDHLLADGLPLLHLRLLDERGKLPPLELHWRVHWYEREFARRLLLPPMLDPRGEWRPPAIDELAALLLFYARDGFIDLRMAADLGAWWDARGAELPADGLEGVLVDYPQLTRAIVAAAVVAERVVGLPAERLLGGRRRLGPRQRVAVRLANPNPRSSQPQLYADMGLIDGLLAPAGGFGEWVKRQLLPPTEVLDQQARHGEKHRTRSPTGRFVGVLGRYTLTLLRRGFVGAAAP